MKVSWDDYSQYMENRTCSKPPTSDVVSPYQSWLNGVPWLAILGHQISSVSTQAGQL
jgi:hypothetical protein